MNTGQLGTPIGPQVPILRHEQPEDLEGSQVAIANTNDGDGAADQNNIIKLSKRRWAILFAMFIFGTTNFLTDELSPILHTMLELLEWPLSKYVYISQLFVYLPALTLLPTSWFIDTYGIKMTMYITTVLMLIRNGSKALLFYTDLPHWESLKYLYWVITSMTGVQILTTYFCLPLKISENWFATSERSLAWTVMISSGNIGFSLGAFIMPRFIHGKNDVKPLFWLNIITAIITTVTVLTCITKSKPKHPPSERMIASSSEPIPYMSSIKKMLKNRDMQLHLFLMSIFEGMSLTIYSLLQDILGAVGQSDVFIGNLMSINSLVSIVALIAFSLLVHRVKDVTIICKLGASSVLVSFLLLTVLALYQIPGWLILLVSVIHKILISWATPNFNNMTAHLASGVVSEATVAGFSTLITIVIMTMSRIIFVALIKTDGKKSDYTYSVAFAISVLSAVSVLYILMFKGKSTRTEDPERSE